MSSGVMNFKDSFLSSSKFYRQSYRPVTLLRATFEYHSKIEESKIEKYLRWLNTVLAVCEYVSFAKSWQEKGSSSQAETMQVKNILMKDFD